MQSWRADFLRKLIGLQKYADRYWYLLVISALALVDIFVVIIPTDGLFISTCLILPKRWLRFAVAVAIASSVGCLILGALVHFLGPVLVSQLYGSLDQSSIWVWTEKFFADYGLLILFLTGLSPLPQQPAVIIAVLAHVDFLDIGGSLLAGRLLKYLVLGYVASYMPSMLLKLWGISGEMREIGVNVER